MRFSFFSQFELRLQSQNVCIMLGRTCFSEGWAGTAVSNLAKCDDKTFTDIGLQLQQELAKAAGIGRAIVIAAKKSGRGSEVVYSRNLTRALNRPQKQ